MTPRLTTLAAGGGCACKLPPGSLRHLLAGLPAPVGESLLVSHNTADDASVVQVAGDLAVISTVDFFTPVVDDPYDWGRIAATNALSDVYAMGGRPVAALNLLAWPAETLPLEIAAEVLRGGQAVADQAGCPVSGGHSITAPEPLYGMAVTGVAHPDRLLRVDAAEAGLPLTLTKPLGVGVLNARTKATGVVSDDAVRSMTTLNADAAAAALASGARSATDVTGFGLLGHLHSLLSASGIAATIEAGAVPYLPEVREAFAAGHLPGGSRRNLAWVRHHLDTELPEDELLLLADAQTSGGLLVVGEVPGYPVVGWTRPGPPGTIRVVA